MQTKPTPLRKSKYKLIISELKGAVLQVAFNKEKIILGSGNLGQFYKLVNDRMAHKSGVAPLKDRTSHLPQSIQKKLSYSMILLYQLERWTVVFFLNI